MFKLFQSKIEPKAFPEESFDVVYKREQQQKNETAQRLVQDFPWLWAINNHRSRSDADYIKVNQDMTDLKMVLAVPSKKASFSMWAITSEICNVFNMQATCLSPLDDKTWAEAVMEQTNKFHDILYLVKVDHLSKFQERTTIFRHPGKTPLNHLVENVVQLQGGSAYWKIPIGMD